MNTSMPFLIALFITLNGVCEGISKITLSFVNLSVCFFAALPRSDTLQNKQKIRE